MPRMLPDGRRLGAHLPLGRGMVKAVDRAHEIGADALQVFADNPTAWRRRAAPPAEGPAFRERLIELDIRPVAIHASYLVNLAGPEEDFFGRSVGVLASELRAAPWFAARYVNVHIGSHRGAGVPAGIARLADGLAPRHGRGRPDARWADDRARERRRAAASGSARTWPSWPASPRPAWRTASIGIGSGFCLDAAHAWAAGIDLSDPDATDRFLADFDGRIGLDRLVMIHLNDSKSELGSRVDRHEHLGAGRIGVDRLASPARPSVAGARHVLPRDARDGRGLRRDQCRAGL